jgi:glutamate racemase
LVEHLFRQHLPPATRILSQPEIVADSLEDYLVRRPRFIREDHEGNLVLLTTGEPDAVSARARVFWPNGLSFERVGI